MVMRKSIQWVISLFKVRKFIVSEGDVFKIDKIDFVVRMPDAKYRDEFKYHIRVAGESIEITEKQYKQIGEELK
jgi:hypothetical protein